MRRKFIGALLFGALLVAPTSTFVSCSDYDDEIDNLQAQINANKSEMGTLVSDKITAVEAVIANLEAADASIEAQLADLEEADAATMAAAQSLIQAAGQELMGSMQQVVEMVKGNTASIEALVAADAKLTTAIETAQAKAEAAYTLAQAADAKATEALDALATVKKSLDAQEAKITALDAKLVAELEKLAEFEAAVNAQIAALQAAGSPVNEELKKLADAIKDQEAALTKVINDAVAGVQKNLDKEVDALKVSVGDVTSAYQNVVNDVNGVKADLIAVQEALNTEIKTQVEALTAKMDILGMLLSSELKSLVFEPVFYYQGIEAFDAQSYKYDAWQTNEEVTADGNHYDDKPWEYIVDGTRISKTVIPDLTAVYHLNPSNAAIDTKDMNKFNFIVFNRDYKRASEKTISPVIYNAVAQNGKLTVKAHFSNAELIRDINAHEEVTVLALQYTKGFAEEGDTVITSDYAAVRADERKDFALNLVGTTDCHLYTTAQEAIDNDPQVAIAYNNDKGIDLRTLVNTHYDVTATCQEWDKNAASGTVELSGFKYSYDLVGYWDGANKTSETAHFGFKDGYMVRAQLTKDGKQQAWGYEQNKATIGREPLVRVTLTDTINDLKVAVGYIKFLITEFADPAQPFVPNYTTVAFGPYNDAYTVECDDEVVFEQKLKWYEVEEQILALLHMEKAEFHNLYALEMESGAAGAVQYVGKEETAAKYTDFVGTVVQTIVDTDATQTEVIKWTVTNNDAYKLFKNGKKPVVVYVRYALKPGKDATYDYVNIELTWTPEFAKTTPSGAVSNDDKISNYWYGLNEGKAETGYDDVHVNVEVIGQQGATCSFKTDLKNVFVGNVFPEISEIDPDYAALVAASHLDIVFVEPAADAADANLYKAVPGASGATYDLYVLDEPANKCSWLMTGVNTKVARLSYDGKFTYASNPVSKDLLNYAGHNMLNDKETLTAKVGFKLTTCAPVNVFDLANNTFYVKILRPITVTDGTAEFEDAATNGSTAKVNFTFTDWREKNFVEDAVNADYFTYYEVTAIKPDLNAILTNMNQKDKSEFVALTGVTKQVKFNYEPATTIGVNEYGTLIYENNGNTVSNFEVKIPVDVTYKWGTIKTWIHATVGKTVANTNKK